MPNPLFDLRTGLSHPVESARFVGVGSAWCPVCALPYPTIIWRIVEATERERAWLACENGCSPSAIVGYLGLDPLECLAPGAPAGWARDYLATLRALAAGGCL